MKLSPRTILNLALMICGDDPYRRIFPYRTSSQLTTFFINSDLNFVHDGSTRKWWVEDRLKELNEISEDSSALPSPELIKVIQALMDPIEYSRPDTDLDKALAKINLLLRSQGLAVAINEKRGLAEIMTLGGEVAQTSPEGYHMPHSIIFSPEVFDIPQGTIDRRKVAVIMPFSRDFDDVYKTIKETCKTLELDCFRSDDIWDKSEIIQDIFELLYSSKIIIADITGKNPNVFYELGIAHTLGRKVIPISQARSDVPFDIQHHRILIYLNNDEGRIELQRALVNRLESIITESQ
jgi:hypothetical protein